MYEVENLSEKIGVLGDAVHLSVLCCLQSSWWLHQGGPVGVDLLWTLGRAALALSTIRITACECLGVWGAGGVCVCGG